MKKIVLDDSTLSQLTGEGEDIRICDSSGTVVGLFTPTTAHRLEPQLSEEEMRKRSSETGWLTTEEFEEALFTFGRSVSEVIQCGPS